MKHTTKQGRSIAGWIVWIFIRAAACVAVAALAEFEPPWLKRQSPELLQNLSLGASAVFGLISLTYLYWAVRYSNTVGYRPSAGERLGLLCSGSGALLMAGKFGFPDHLTGNIQIYLLAAMLLAFIIRPMMEHIGWKSKPQPQ